MREKNATQGKMQGWKMRKSQYGKRADSTGLVACGLANITVCNKISVRLETHHTR